MTRRTPPPTTPDSAAVIARLHALANPANAAGMARFGIRGENILGISVTTLRGVAKDTGRSHDLAAALWASGIHEARVLACLVDEPEKTSSRQLDAWACDLDSWDLCDGFADLVAAGPHSWTKVRQWAKRREEFVRRAAFATIASLAVHDKAADDTAFIALMPLIRAASNDDRNFVKKAVNWALRNIGKRNMSLHAAAIAEAEALRALDSRSARWIAADALRELRSEATIERIRARNTRQAAAKARDEAAAKRGAARRRA